MPASLPLAYLCHSVNRSAQVFSAVFGTSFSVFLLANCSVISSECESKRNFDSVRKEAGIRLEKAGFLTGRIMPCQDDGLISVAKIKRACPLLGTMRIRKAYDWQPCRCTQTNSRKSSLRQINYSPIWQVAVLSVTGELAVLWPSALAVRSPRRTNVQCGDCVNIS